MWVLSLFGMEVATIGSEFSYLLPDGTEGNGIPYPTAVYFAMGTPGSAPINWAMITRINACSIFYGGTWRSESLLCAVVLDNMTGTKHHSIVNLLAKVGCIFGGITATVQ